jgi:hypothetical protein
MITITSKKQLLDLAKELGVRDDWHEPDEQEVTAKVFGKSFNNAGFYGIECHISTEQKELYVVLYKDEKPVGEIALATLFAFACDTYSGF